MKWIKDNGDEIETNDLDATIEACVKMGWEPADKKIAEAVAEKPKKRGRPAKNKELN
jgi:hypothetical protein